MRTKALILTAALSAAAVANSLAQVYSVNAVGYVNVTVNKGYNLLCNPLKNGNNMLDTLIPGTSALPDGTLVFTWNPQGGSIGSPDPAVPEFFPGDGWDPDGKALAPGNSFWLFIPSTAPQASYTITFVGEVAEGNLVTDVYGGNRWNALASQVPQAGKINTDLKFPAQGGDLAYIWNKDTDAFPAIVPEYFPPEGAEPGFWDPAEPTVGVGEGFWIFRSSTAVVPWTRTFDVDNPN
jgi:hypothetical protein